MLETFSYPTTRAAKAEFRPAFARGESVDIARAVAAIGRIQAVPTLLQILCDTTGMGLAAVARVTDTNWTACAIRDSVNSGITPGSQLDVNTTLCIEVKSTGVPIVTDRASSDPSYCNHPARALYNIESYISVPILLPNDEYFGNLFAIGQKPTMVSDPKILSMFEGFAKLIGYQLNEQLQIDEAHAALLDERAVSELREQFIGILGHDLRNPLQALFATTDLLSKRHGDEWSVKLTSRMKANVRRMSLMIEDVLDFTRARLGSGIGVRIQTIENLDEGLDAVVKELQDARPERSIVSQINVKRSVRCDLGRVQQLASNLLSNALMHGAPTSTVTFDAFVSDDQLIIKVWNEGEPIPPESIDKIFAPFWRCTTSTNRDGLGLGLHICSQIVSAHGGHLSVSSSAEMGTQFVVNLPCIDKTVL